MSRGSRRGGRRRPSHALWLLAFAGLLAVCVMVARPVDAGAQAGGQLVAEPVASAAAAGARQLFGASPLEAPGEIWGVGEAAGERSHLIRYTEAGGWEAVPDPIDAATGATLPLPSSAIPRAATAGRTTPGGGVVSVVTVGPEGSSAEALIVRDPGGPFRVIAAPPAAPPKEETEGEKSEGGKEEEEPPKGEEPEKELSEEEKEKQAEKEKEEAEKKEEKEKEEAKAEREAEEKEVVLKEGEELFGGAGAIMLAAVEETDGKTGAFIVPRLGSAPANSVLHFDGAKWIREPICLEGFVPATRECAEPPKAGSFKVVAIEAAGPGQEWILARRSGTRQKAEGIVLLKRQEGAWVKQAIGGELGAIFGKESPTLGTAKVTIKARESGQPLTVSSQGLWVDATVSVGGRGTDATIYYDGATGEFTGSWCDPPESTPEAESQAWQQICRFPLGSELAAGEGRSFAWPGNGGPGEEFGTRAITGIGQGAMLIFENGAFSRIPLSGNGGTSAGAALSAPDQGWLGPSYKLTRAPLPSGLVSYPVPFRRPLLAVTPQPGQPVGSLNSQALAVGALGEVARYLPGVGWQPESLVTGSGTRATPNLRAVAWPTPSFAYAVGDEGAMWLWRATTGLWEPDPAAPPNLIRGDFTGIAFDPNEPERGYAVGKQGLLLGYGKRWTQEALPAGVSPEANITGIAFAGDEALATWTLAVPAKVGSEPEYTGGMLVNTGSGWQVDEGAGKALAELEAGIGGFAPRRIAALPDGGAVIVGFKGAVIEREAAGAPWHAVPGPLLGYPSAVAAVREGGQLRALVSAGETITERDTDRGQALGQPPEGQAPLLTEPYPLPANGFLIRQTATGWQDEERDSYPQPPEPTNQKGAGTKLDLPREPDPVLGLLLNSEGTEGWAVGGQTGERASKQFGSYLGEGLQTASAMRYGSSAAPPANALGVPITTSPEEATFAIGGGAACAGACADLTNTGIGPDVWLRAGVGRAASIPGVRAFLYTGGGVSPNLDLTKVTRRAFVEEEEAYARRLGAEAGTLPVFAAPAASDRYESSLVAFGTAFSGFPSPLGLGAGFGVQGVPAGEGEREAGNYSYAFNSTDLTGAGAVRVVVLDDSVAPVPQQNLCWLGGQLAAAKAAGTPAIVVGNRDAQGEAELTQMLVTGSSALCPQEAPGGASAFFFEAEGNTQATLSSGSTTIPDYGSGSLGYIKVPESLRSEQVPASGFLLASVNLAGRSISTNIAPVSVRLIPSIGSLAIDALDGTFLRRSQTALFEALARRPIAGVSCTSEAGSQCLPTSPDPYVQIPARCVNGRGYKGRPCSLEIAPEYRFSSSRPDIANFVKVDPNSSNPRAVFLDSNEKPVADPTSGLLCTFNSGTTVVSVEAGGLAYSVPITVQAGSVARPCGTVPRTDLTAVEKPLETPPPPIEAEPGFKPTPESIPPPPVPSPPSPTPVPNPIVLNPITTPTPLPVAHHLPAKPPVPLQVPFFAPTPLIAPVPVIVPPAPPAAAEPAPPTGTSPVTEPAVSPEPEEEEEAAFDLVHHAIAYLPGGRVPPALQASASQGGNRVPSALLPALLILAAVALAGAARPRLRRSPEPAFHRNRPQRRPFDEYP